MAKKRKNGQGTVRLRSDGRWEGRLVVGYKENGTAKTKSFLSKSKTECLEKMRAFQYAEGERQNKENPDMLFGEWLDYWYQNYLKITLRKTTQSDYECRIYQHIIPNIGNIPLRNLKTNDLQQFYAKLKTSGRLIRRKTQGKGLSDRVVRGCHTTCKSALQKAVEENLIRSNPAVACKLPPKKSKEMQILTPEEMQRFLIQAKAEGYYELFLLELATGMRRGEILGLQWKDLNYQTGQLKIQRQVHMINGKLIADPPKTKSSIRTILLPKSILEVLKTYHKTVKSKWMFPSPKIDDAPRNPTAVYKRMKIILERANCKELRFHDLRHTFATTALENGMDIKTLSTVIGHVTAATTLDVYSHITNQMQQTASIQIDRGIGHTNAQMPSFEEKHRKTLDQSDYKPNWGKKRKSGTGCITKINDHLYEGRYSPTDANGKRITKNIYAHTEAECEEKLAELIREMKEEIRKEKALLRSF